MSRSSAAADVGEVLIERGWRQGSLLPAVGHASYGLDNRKAWQVLAVPPATGERLVVVSQECDIVARSEPFVEAMACSWQPKGSPSYSAGRIGNSGRAFLLRRTPDATGEEGGLIVDATRRVQIVKASLLDVVPETSLTTEERTQFVGSGRGSEGATAVRRSTNASSTPFKDRSSEDSLKRDVNRRF